MKNWPLGVWIVMDNNMLKLNSMITIGYEKGEIDDVPNVFESKHHIILYLKLVGGWLKMYIIILIKRLLIFK